MSKTQQLIKRIQELTRSGLSQLWAGEVDAFAIGMGSDESIEDEDTDEAISFILDQYEELINKIMGGDEDEEDEDDDKPIKKTTKAKKAPKITKPGKPSKSDKPGKPDKPKRAPSAYNVFIARVSRDWKENNTEQPEGGIMKYCAAQWSESVMNPKSENYDEDETAEIMAEATSK